MSGPARLKAGLFLVMLCLSGAPCAAQTAPAAAAAQYRLRPGDAVRLMIKDEPLLTGEYPVLEDGTVLLPLVGLVRVAGEDFDGVTEAVRSAYAGELRGSVIVLQPLIRVRVLGEVRVPGLYLVDATHGLQDVLARAGGLAPSASTRRVELVRGGRTERIDVRDVAALEAVGRVEPGDEVVVPRRSWLSENVPILIGAGTSVLAAAVTALLVR